jgi:hypothetical protein
MQDQKIIELIRLNKHDQALLALYKIFPAVRKMIRSKGGNAADALVQIIFRICVCVT